MATKYKETPVGTAGPYPWVNRADTKFNADGIYKLGLIVEADKAAAWKAEIDKLVDEAFEERVTSNDKLKPGEKKKYTKYYPYSEVEDDDGNPTGKIIFHLKQNAIIRLPDGEEKKVVIGLRNAADEVDTSLKVFGGTVVKALWAPRAITLASEKKVGIRLDFCAVMVLKQAPYEGKGSGFTTEDEYAYADKMDDADAAGHKAGDDSEY